MISKTSVLLHVGFGSLRCTKLVKHPISSLSNDANKLLYSYGFQQFSDFILHYKEAVNGVCGYPDVSVEKKYSEVESLTSFKTIIKENYETVCSVHIHCPSSPILHHGYAMF